MSRSLHGTPPSDIGLRTRMRGEERRISSQHRQLDELLGAVFEGLEEAGAEGAVAPFRRFADALEAHLALEESIYFPALHGLRPDLGPELVLLVEQHEGVRRSVATVSARFEAGTDEGAADHLDTLANAIADHEAEEEELIARISTGPLGNLGQSTLSD